MRDSFSEIVEEIWHLLRQGVDKAADPFHTPVLGTVTPDGCSLRTVVLRQVVVPERLLICHTDSRSPKCREIAAAPSVSWLFYHPAEKIQLRIYGEASVHTQDGWAERQWQASKLSSRRCYAALDAPGTPKDEPSSGLPEALTDRIPTPAQSEVGRPHFTVIVCRVISIDWLFLQASGHRRAQFRWQDGTLNSTWVTP